MLFAYTYVPHQMEKMQEYIDFIFHEVWCKAPAAGPFGLGLFDANAELKQLMEDLHYSETAGAEFFVGNVQKIYVLFAALSTAQIQQLQRWYLGNNDLEGVCANDAETQLARYADIDSLNEELSKQLAVFFKGLYDKSLLGLAVFKANIGDIDDHYNKFVNVNRLGKCPFCGTTDIRGQHSSTREAYDHYLPKALYPFNSINFRNLLPACHTCNSGYKTSKDPAHTPKDAKGAQHRRRVFYPYTTKPHAIEVTVKLGHGSIEKLMPGDVDIQFGPVELGEEIATWRDVYGIDDRYRDKLCGADAKAWVEEVRILMRRLPAEDSIAIVREQSQADPFANSNFLKLAFLNACDTTGLFAVMTEYV